ncbi:MAG: TonB-dependent receptor [Rikenellaceae bacterium]|nr:TonB-dependent receptor [Rikenellaceae bacterium]
MKKYGVAVILSLFSFHNLFCEQAPEVYADLSGEPVQVEQIAVTATRTPLPLKDTPVLTRMLTARDIELSGATSLPQLLERELAGVEFHQAGYGTSLSFQGLDARYILFLIDGERIAGETYGNIDFNRIALSDVERIEIVRGSSSVLYGSNAMGAVINVITRSPVDKIDIAGSVKYAGYYQRNREYVDGIRSHTKQDIPNVDADLYMGFNFGKFKAQTTVAYSGRDAYQLFGTKEEVRHYDAYQKMNVMTGVTEIISDTTVIAPIDTLGLSISGWRSVSVTQKVSYEFSEKINAFAAVAYYTKSRYDFPESLNTGSADGDNYTFERYNTYTLRTGVEFQPNAYNYISLSYTGDLSRKNMDSLQFSVPKQKHMYNSPRLLWTVNAGRYNRVTTGLEFLNETLNFDLSRYGYNDKRSVNTVTLYSQDEINTNMGLSFIAGIRIEKANRYKWNFTPKASVKYSLDDLSFRGSYSRGYRNPTLKELYMDYKLPIGGGSNMYVVGNPELEPEHNQYISFTAEYTKGFTNFSVTAFKSYFRKKIDVREIQNGTRTDLFYENIDKSRFSGIELIAKSRLAKELFVTANYNYIDQSEDAPEASTQYIFVSPHSAAIILNYGVSLGRNTLYFDISGKITGKKTYEDFMAAAQMPYVYMGTYSAKHNAYSIWNCSVALDIRGVRIMAGIDNLFDYKSPVVNFNSCMAPSRYGYVKLSFNIKEK